MLKILMIDDSIFTLNSYKGLVSSLGHEVFTATNLDDIQAIIAKESLDLVLCDLMMPEHDGFEVFGIIKKIQPNINFIFVTADLQDSTRDKALQLGADGLLNKPLTLESIGEALKKYAK